MKGLFILSAAAIIGLATLAQAADKKLERAANSYSRIPSGALTGSFSEYSGTLSDEYAAPTKKEMKVNLSVTGRLARDLFLQLGPKSKEPDCDSEIMIESRRRGDIDCVQYRKEGFRCWFGLDTATGKSINEVSC